MWVVDKDSDMNPYFIFKVVICPKSNYTDLSVRMHVCNHDTYWPVQTWWPHFYFEQRLFERSLSFSIKPHSLLMPKGKKTTKII